MTAPQLVTEQRPATPSRSHTRAVERPAPDRTGAEWALTFLLADLLTEARTTEDCGVRP